MRGLPSRVPRARKRDLTDASILSPRATQSMTSEKLTLEDIQNKTPIPEILQAEWARDQVNQLFDDLRDGADVQHVQLRSTTTDTVATLAEAKLAFDSGEAQAIQVRYLFEQEVWCDTILPGDPTTKIVRSRLPVEGNLGS